ncbi:hypothetical protein NA57DRAFT_55837 [Rhizodiscina lignyota]|uniref:Uncharacterized protein n=1 Tax=Rhizodiscina lignyota TaxID=1504668 RepID=A0A9P4IIH6_9PEZI|nr:hypothetical protein NA57DRAFT_55837 [Rhizodiscina lignyota]
MDAFITNDPLCWTVCAIVGLVSGYLQYHAPPPPYSDAGYVEPPPLRTSYNHTVYTTFKQLRWPIPVGWDDDHDRLFPVLSNTIPVPSNTIPLGLSDTANTSCLGIGAIIAVGFLLFLSGMLVVLLPLLRRFNTEDNDTEHTPPPMVSMVSTSTQTNEHTPPPTVSMVSKSTQTNEHTLPSAESNLSKSTQTDAQPRNTTESDLHTELAAKNRQIDLLNSALNDARKGEFKLRSAANDSRQREIRLVEDVKAKQGRLEREAEEIRKRDALLRSQRLALEWASHREAY